MNSDTLEVVVMLGGLVLALAAWILYIFEPYSPAFLLLLFTGLVLMSLGWFGAYSLLHRMRMVEGGKR